MALLHRFTRLNDRGNTGVFTFIVTRSVTRDLHRDATTKDFVFAYHKWAVSFTRSETMLGVYLLLRNPTPGTKCYADFAFSLLNREHFSKNETFAEKQCRFSPEHPAHGSCKWILMSDLRSRRFTDENGEFLLELAMGNVLTAFEHDLPLRPSAAKLETPFFVFGGFEWNLLLLPHDENGRPRVFLNRLTGFDHPCRVQYRVLLGEAGSKADSGLLDQISDAHGRIRGFALRAPISELGRRGHLRVTVEMLCANTISEVRVAATPVREPSEEAGANCYDRDKQGWCLEVDTEGEYLRLKLFYPDLHHIPRNHLRYVSCNAFVVRPLASGSRESVLVVNNPHSNYYVQDGMDTGVLMETDIPIADIRKSPSPYLENGQLTVHLEWLDSMLLFGALYHKYDDIPRVHTHQMRREISALQAENYSLERQLVSYQKSISMAAGSSRVPHPGGVSNNDEYYSNHELERSLSEGQSLSESEYT